MPVRNIIYDALQYGKQVSDIAAKHKNQGDRSGHNRGEYLSGFYKEDRIRPVITLVVHFGANEWDGPLSLHEMMDLKDERLLEFVQDYRIFLIDPYKLDTEDLNVFLQAWEKYWPTLNIQKIKTNFQISWQQSEYDYGE